ncbi:hypothetical protein [Pseudoxanthomonas dokdonensis]|uniref:KTSC domain-containing protein n=1 Tax=Pseudoxanthomonas dokdonensis TaxID=344882 RepID=A0A0R0CRQ4_9GAMM|nr:hypothetical protein [Pseudoxanthomonas dokdonensis]KRG68276.1 hypothetical protein ABB29_13165 [Pseudoxanthomonas dokdonensis]
MQRYLDLSGDSGVAAYDIRTDAIAVRFHNSPRIYVYSHASAGTDHVRRMKRLAQAGQGLSSYISRYVHDRYEP